MKILGIHGSPRLKGNTRILLDAFLKKAYKMGAKVHKLEVAKLNVKPCVECGSCEIKGYCALDDDMQDIYPLIWDADLIVLATPIFFYGPTAQVKALIDRSQALWARKYRKGLEDPGRKHRKGIFIGVGATKGKNLFDGSKLIAKYFFDACGASYIDEYDICVRKVEKPGEIHNYPEILDNAAKKGEQICDMYLKRKKIVFVCKENACRSQMAWAFFKKFYGNEFDVRSAGSNPAEEINPNMVQAMENIGIDMAYIKPKSLDNLLKEFTPQYLVTMDCEQECPYIPGAKKIEWDIEDPAGKDMEFMVKTRDIILDKVKKLYEELKDRTNVSKNK